MPLITEKVVTEKVTGLICDRCGKHDHNGFNDFNLEHTFGFDSSADEFSVEAAICDDCLIDIMLEMVPHARFRYAYGETIERDTFRAKVQSFRARFQASKA